jgi:hypothetical protein
LSVPTAADGGAGSAALLFRPCDTASAWEQASVDAPSEAFCDVGAFRGWGGFEDLRGSGGFEGSGGFGTSVDTVVEWGAEARRAAWAWRFVRAREERGELGES